MLLICYESQDEVYWNTLRLTDGEMLKKDGAHIVAPAQPDPTITALFLLACLATNGMVAMTRFGTVNGTRASLIKSLIHGSVRQPDSGVVGRVHRKYIVY